MNYRGLIWTNHILQRMKERGLTHDDVFWAFSKPDQVFDAKAYGGYKYYRRYKDKRLSVVAKKNDKGEWILLTCWIKDFKDNFRNKSERKPLGFWKNLWRMLIGK